MVKPVSGRDGSATHFYYRILCVLQQDEAGPERGGTKDGFNGKVLLPPDLKHSVCL